MDTFSSVIYGFQVATQPMNLAYCFIGVFIGTLVGVLPGIGPAGSIALLLPTTFHLNPTSGIIMLAGIWYGVMFGGSRTSILVNIPGEPTSVVTCLDGYPMTLKGRAGPALGIAAFASFIAGTFAIIGLTLMGPVLAEMALKFGPPEFFSLMIVGIMILSYLSSGSMIKALMFAAVGMILGGVGMDLISGKYRFTFGIQALLDGIGLIPVVMGLFGISEVLVNLETEIEGTIVTAKIKNILPTLKDWADSIWAIVRGTLLGFFMGIIPGGGAIVATFASYAIEKKISKHPEEFGKGAIQGVAAPEAANNAAAGGAFIPLLTLGIPPNAVMAIFLGALMIHGLEPGPLLIHEAPEVFWGLIVSMYIGNVILMVLNLPLIGLWVKILKVPYFFLYPLIILFCLIGVYSVRNNAADVVIMFIFGILGYLARKFGYQGAPLVLAMVLGPMLEESFRQSLITSHGSFAIFFTRPISLGFLLVAFILLVIPFIIRQKKLPVDEET
jgi:putative tricarboxylic transport membrane protein